MSSLYYPAYLKGGDDVYWINIAMENSTSKSSSRVDGFDYDGNIKRDLILLWEQSVQPLTDFQRLIFLVATIFIVGLALVGNMLVLYVNFSRYSDCIHD